MTVALKNIVRGIDTGITDTISLTQGLSPVVVNAVVVLSDSLEKTIVQVVNNVTNGFENDVALNTSMATAVESLVVQADYIDAVLLSGTNTDLAIKTFIDYVKELQVQAENLTSQLQNLNAVITETANTGTFEIISKFAIPAELNSSSLLSDIKAGSIPEVATQLNDLRVPNIPDLRQVSADLKAKYAGLPNQIKDLLNGNSSGEIIFYYLALFTFVELGKEIRAQIANAKITLKDAVVQATSQIIQDLGNIKKDISSVNDQVTLYDGYRVIGFIVLFALAFFIIFIYFITMVTRSPKGSKR